MELLPASCPCIVSVQFWPSHARSSSLCGPSGHTPHRPQRRAASQRSASRARRAYSSSYVPSQTPSACEPHHGSKQRLHKWRTSETTQHHSLSLGRLEVDCLHPELCETISQCRRRPLFSKIATKVHGRKRPEAESSLNHVKLGL